MNSLKIFLLFFLLAMLFIVVGYALGGQNGMIIAFFLAAVMNFFSYWYSDKIVLKMYRARKITATDHPRLHRIVSMVSQKAMIPMPSVYIIPTKAPNAFATGRNEDHAAVAATEGLLEILNDAELEGVIGHEIAHVVNRDMLIQTLAATMAAAIGILASMARWAAIFGGVSRDNNDRGGGGPFGLIVAMIVAPLAAMLIQMAISRNREYKADAGGAEITGQPLALASALEKLHRAPIRMNLDKQPATAHLFIANPLSGKSFSALFSTHPPVEKRIEKLRQSVMGGYE
ncbi:MAG: zinc metalloprotease HtpX [Candidatus Zixiibacteriota bacterium]